MEVELKTMYQYIYGNWQTMIAFVYAELGIADLIKQEPKTVNELAELTATDPRALNRVLRCAAVLGLHNYNVSTGQLKLTKLGNLLCSESFLSLRAAARLNGSSYRYAPWGRLLDYVRLGTGQGLSPCWENGSLDYLQDKPEELAVFEEAMTNLSQSTYARVDENKVIAEQLNFSKLKKVLDIGGGQGSLLQAILSVHDSLQGTVMDLPCVLQNIPLPSAENPGDSRLTKLEGDFYKSIPTGYDLYLLKNVIHNHPENRVIKILNNIYKAMLEKDSVEVPCSAKRLILFEMVMPEDSEIDPVSSFTDLNLNLLVGGSVRNKDEYKELLNQCGFELICIDNLPDLERRVIWTKIDK